MHKRYRRSGWTQWAAALLLALGLFAATGVEASAAKKLSCANLSWDNLSWDCTSTETK